MGKNEEAASDCKRALKMIEGLDARNARADLAYLKVIADDTAAILGPELVVNTE